MRNAEDHKKLLEQITELERDSVNYFDVEREFFLIDSDNLSEVQTRFYGYSIQANGIYEEDNLTPEAVKNLDGRGCYVYVEVYDGQITIKQDLNGCWGIYLFRHGDYFALSNSFFRLLDHVKFRYPLTLNRDYCNYLLISIVAIQSYMETAVKEIARLERNAIIHIDILKKDLQIELIDYKEHSVVLDSEEGVLILDRWVEFWGSLLRNLAQNTKFIQADLSGGFDTRIHFVPLLYSGLDLNQIRINSSKEKSNPVFVEDYDIASQIAAQYNFKLNLPLPERQFLNYSLSDAWNSDLYSQQTIRNLPTVSLNKKSVDKLYHLTGFSGEVLRKTWHMSPKKFMEQECSRAVHYYKSLAYELARSTQKIIQSVFRSMCDKYHIEDKTSVDIPQYLYHETRSRNHCGKTMLVNYLKNVITIVPSHDPEIQTLQLKSSKYSDYNLLMILLFTRYAPDLLKIRFDKFHEAIDIETLVSYAKKINKRFPRRTEKGKYPENGGGHFYLQPRDKRVEKILASGRNNSSIPKGFPEKVLKATFESSKTYGLFTAHFDEKIYRYAENYYDNHSFGRDRLIYSVCSVAKVLEDVEISQRNHPPYQDLKRFLEQDFCKVHFDDSSIQIINRFKPYFTARIDVKFAAEGEFQILFVSDDKVMLSKPEWFQKGGIGYIINSYSGNLKFVVKAAENGQIQLALKGRFVLDAKEKAKHIPYWIDYTKLIVNGQTVFNTLIPVWHDKPYRHTINARANEEIIIEVEWLPHRSDT